MKNNPQTKEPQAKDPETKEALPAEARQRLLQAASEAFAEQGFRNTTIRELCGRAGVNIASVNYYFGDKEGLYAVVLRNGARKIKEKYPLTPEEISQFPTPEERLSFFVHRFLQRIFACERSIHHGKLLMHELIEPTRALDALIEEMYRPTAMLLISIVRDLLGAQADDRQVYEYTDSILGQCVYYYSHRNLLTRLYPERSFEPDEIQKLADHVVQFSLNAFRALKKEVEGESDNIDAKDKEDCEKDELTSH